MTTILGTLRTPHYLVPRYPSRPNPKSKTLNPNLCTSVMVVYPAARAQRTPSIPNTSAFFEEVMGIGIDLTIYRVCRASKRKIKGFEFGCLGSDAGF